MDFLSLFGAGLANGSLYALVALGLMLVFKAQDVVNFAHGELFMIGAFLAFTAFESLHLPYAVAFVVALAGSAAIGAVAERLTVRPLIASPRISIVMVTVGLSFALKGFARIPWGADIYTFPPIFGAAPVRIGSLILSPQNIVTILFSVGLMVLFFLFFRFTTLGKQMRATSQNQTGASIVGINVGRVFSITWAAAAATGAAAGVLAAPITLLYPEMGTKMLIKAFAAAVLGGFGSIPGAIVGGLAMGIIEILSGAYVTTALMDISAFLVIMVVLFIRPQGLFGVRAAARV